MLVARSHKAKTKNGAEPLGECMNAERVKVSVLFEGGFMVCLEYVLHPCRSATPQ